RRRLHRFWLWFRLWLLRKLRDRVVVVIGDGPVRNLDRFSLQLAVFENNETGDHLRPVSKLVELVTVGFATENRATLVAHGHLGDVAALVVLIFFLAYNSVLEGIGSVFNAIAFDSVGGDFDQFRWSFDWLAVLELDLCRFSSDSTHGAEQSILLLRAVENGDGGASSSDTGVLRLRGRSKGQDSSPQHESRQKPPHNTNHLDSSKFQIASGERGNSGVPSPYVVQTVRKNTITGRELLRNC